MGQAVSGVSVVALLMVVGFVLARTRALPPAVSPALTALVYWAATPCLLYHQLSHADVIHALAYPLAVAALSGIAAAILCAGALVAIRVDRSDVILGAMSGALTNAAHIGLPIALYVLGSGEAVVPLVVFQLSFLTPLFFTLADWVSKEVRFSPVAFLKTLVTNPMVIGMLLGVTTSIIGWRVPSVIDDATRMLGNAAPPLILIAFGASLVGNRLKVTGKTAATVAIASLTKLVVHPLIAFGLARLFGLDHALAVQVTVMAALPSAQNAFVAAQRYNVGMDATRVSVAITSITSLGVILVIAWLFGI